LRLTLLAGSALASHLGLLTTDSLRTLGATSVLVKEALVALLHFRLGFLAGLEGGRDDESGHETEANGGDREYPTRSVDRTCALGSGPIIIKIIILHKCTTTTHDVVVAAQRGVELTDDFRYVRHLQGLNLMPARVGFSLDEYSRHIQLPATASPISHTGIARTLMDERCTRVERHGATEWVETLIAFMIKT